MLYANLTNQLSRPRIACLEVIAVNTLTNYNDVTRLLLDIAR